MKKYHKSCVLLCAPEMAGGGAKWCGVLNWKHGNDIEQVDIIALNVTEKDEIKPLLEHFLAELQQVEENVQAYTESDIQYTENLLKMISNPSCVHEVPIEILVTLTCITGRREDFKTDEVLYLFAEREG